ncbi:hypothetical protein B0H10DRAFT_1969058 [Mycena sp. CBHHK59/15]|nr:hypothetical protein B0H10DRAFT_1969058 [Mycena sp. CBHHK59/15]
MSRKLSLIQLNPHVFLGKPDEIRLCSTAVASPSLLLLFGYTTLTSPASVDARAAHLQKYVDNLHNEFPVSTIVVIKSFSNFFWSSNAHLESMLMPVVDALKSHSAQKSSGILVHILSNGGGFNYMTFHRLLEKLASPRLLIDQNIPSALILDSTPGDHGLKSSISFAAPANPVLRPLTLLPIALLYGIFYAINTLNGNAPIFDQLRATLLSTDVLPTVIDSQGNVKTTPRLYIYSKIDKIADPAEIRAHLEEAERKGFDVAVEVYDTTSHVGHAHKDPERYWASIRAHWEKAVGAKKLIASL